MRWLCLTLICALAPAALTAQKRAPIAQPTDSAKMQGWYALSPASTLDGKVLPAVTVKGTERFTIGRHLIMMSNGQRVLEADITFDVSKRPHTMDYVVSDGPTKGTRFLGVYDFHGDTLRLCFSAIGKPRPKVLAAGAGNAFYLWVPVQR